MGGPNRERFQLGFVSKPRLNWRPDIGRMNHRLGGIQFQLLTHSGNRIQFGFRSKVPDLPSNGPGRMSVAEVESEPQQSVLSARRSCLVLTNQSKCVPIGRCSD